MDVSICVFSVVDPLRYSFCRSKMPSTGLHVQEQVFAQIATIMDSGGNVKENCYRKITI